MLAVVDLFAGPGGLGEGFSSLLDDDGNQIFQIVMSVECDPAAHNTLRLRSFLRKILNQDGTVPQLYLDYLSHPSSESFEELVAQFPNEWAQADKEAVLGKLVEGDVSYANEALKRINSIQHDGVVLIGGPPCQAYSLVGRARRTNDKEGLESDEKQTLYKCYLSFIEIIKPDVFVMENVQGILSAKHAGSGVFSRIISDMKSLGYDVRSLVTDSPSMPADYLVHADKYGIPQSRKRVILLGTKCSMEKKPETLIEVKGKATVGMVLDDLAKLKSGFSFRDKTPQDAWASFIKTEAQSLASTIEDEEIKSVLAEVSEGSLPRSQKADSINGQDGAYNDWYRGRLGSSSLITRHEARTHLGKDLTRYLFCAAYAKTKGRTPNLYDFPAQLLPAHKNIEVLSNSNHGKKDVVFADRFRVQVSDRPSTTITSHIRKDGHYYIHPDPLQCRSLTVREAARLQTFPDDYYFMGNKTEQYQQVGNAVPPMLAQQIAAIVSRLFGYSCKSYVEKRFFEEKSV